MRPSPERLTPLRQLVARATGSVVEPRRTGSGRGSRRGRRRRAKAGEVSAAATRQRAASIGAMPMVTHTLRWVRSIRHEQIG